MKLPSICIDRPVFTIVIALVLFIAGIVSYSRLELRFLPYVFEPTLTVRAYDQGASAQVVEEMITEKLEERLANVPDVNHMESQSGQGISTIQLHFNDISKSQYVLDLSKVEQEVSSVSLPQNVQRPNIYQGGNESQVMVLGINDPNKTVYQLADYAKRQIMPRITGISGVSGLQLWGVESALRIALNPVKMAEMGITSTEIIGVLEANNRSVSSGSIVNKQQQIQINTNSLLPNVNAFQNVIVGDFNGRLVHLKDVAKVYMGPDALNAGYFYINGKPGVGVQVSKTSDGSPLQIGASVEKLIKKLKPELPPGMTIATIYNNGTPLKHSIVEVAETIFEAIILVALITFLFLGSLRTTLIPLVTIPVCLVASCLVLYILGYSINVFTLLASVLAVGLVVDDSIVVLENNHRHIESGMKPMAASRRGSTEIAFAVIGMTICLIAVYLPSAFIGGRVGAFYREFAFTLAAAVAFSGILALTLSPMMCSRILKAGKGNWYEKWIEKCFDNFRAGYAGLLKHVIKARWIVAIIFVLLIVGGGFVFRVLPTATLPRSIANYIAMSVVTPNTSSAKYTSDQVQKILKQIEKIPDYQASISAAGFPFNANRDGFAFLTMKPYAQRKVKNLDKLNEKVNDIIRTDLAVHGFAFPFNFNQMNGFGGGNLSFSIMGYESYKQLDVLAQKMVEALKKDPMVKYAQNLHAYDNQQYEISVNRSLAAQLKVPVSAINTSINTMLNGYTLSTDYEVGGTSYAIIVQLPKSYLGDFKFLSKVYVTSTTGHAYQLSRFVSVKPMVNIYIRNRFDQMRSMRIVMTAKPTAPLGQVVANIKAVAARVLPPTVTLKLRGEARKLSKSNSGLMMAFALGIVFIFLVLAALFESFIDPLIILLTVPLCIIGALLALMFVGGSLNMYTGIGLVTLIGLVSKHGVLITQFANQLRAEGLETRAAVIKAAGIRLRPILMTTSTMVLGAVPLLFATGAGSEGRSQIGWVIIAGLIVGTVFSLFVVPVAYTIFAKLKRKNKSHF